MTPDEKRLIDGLFERMRGYELPEKDREAEALINQSVRSIPDAPYMLVQSVLVQEQALEAANGRVQELEARVRVLEDGGARPKEATGGFLGGLLGGSRPATAQRTMSVPAIGARAAGQSAWAASGTQSQTQPQAQPQTGGFLRTAMATAAGVAGGMLLADGIRNMMGGSSAAHAGTPASSGTSGEAGSRQEAAREGSDEPVQQDANTDSGFDSDWGGDLDI